MKLLKVYPHAHLLCREMKGWATLPNGDVQWLLHIKEWDFNWQDEYRFADAISLPKGATLHMEYAYDNSAGNVRNPHDPPRQITYSESTTGEMGDLWFQVIPEHPGERPLLESRSGIHEITTYLDATRARLAADPGETGTHKQLAYLYSRLRQFDPAIEHMMSYLRVETKDAGAHVAVGTWLHELERHGEALQHYRMALTLKPGLADAHYAMGLTLASKRSTAEAIEQFQKALELNPHHADSRVDLGVTLAIAGRFDEAESQFRSVLEGDPGSPRANLNLGKTLARRGDLVGAHRCFERAVRAGSALSPGDRAAAHYSLASILSRTGRMVDALDPYRKTLEIRPDHRMARQDLALALVLTGDPDAGIEQFRLDVRQQSRPPRFFNDMAWALATHADRAARRPATAVEFAERAATLTNRRHPGILDTLAVAYASAGRFDKAVRTSTEALALAPPESVKEIQERRERFRKGEAL